MRKYQGFEHQVSGSGDWMRSLVGLSTETNTRVKYEGPMGYPGGSIWWADSLIQGSDQEEICTVRAI